MESTKKRNGQLFPCENQRWNHLQTAIATTLKSSKLQFNRHQRSRTNSLTWSKWLKVRKALMVAHDMTCHHKKCICMNVKVLMVATLPRWEGFRSACIIWRNENVHQTKIHFPRNCRRWSITLIVLVVRQTCDFCLASRVTAKRKCSSIKRSRRCCRSLVSFQIEIYDVAAESEQNLIIYLPPSLSPPPTVDDKDSRRCCCTAR